MNEQTGVRVRFAPSPTGTMHLGNIRIALMNYLFALKHNGSFIIRIEDTDTQRNFDPHGAIILQHLAWLGLKHQEGPDIGGPYGPYAQSERTAYYDKIRTLFIEKNALYRCFCTEAELEKKRLRQEALKQPPRYDRTCVNLDHTTVTRNIAESIPYIWRVKLNLNDSVSITDMAHGTIEFHMRNFADFPISRQDGTYTFLFANFVDDMLMKITHVMRGEDHLSNTARQAILFALCDQKPPIYWHMPIICTIEGKKLSKRKLDTSLDVLRDTGYLPEAIANYLALIGSTLKSDQSEIMSLEELAHTINMDHPPVTGQIKYDTEKLRWINHKWIARYTAPELARACHPFLLEAYPEIKHMSNAHIGEILQHVQTDLITLKDSVAALHFYFIAPTLTTTHLYTCVPETTCNALGVIIQEKIGNLHTPDIFMREVSTAAKAQQIGTKELFHFLRLILMGSTSGPSVNALLLMLGNDKSLSRILYGLNLLKI